MCLIYFPCAGSSAWAASVVCFVLVSLSVFCVMLEKLWLHCFILHYFCVLSLSCSGFIASMQAIDWKDTSPKWP